jgi:hypothetical protein
MSEVARYQVVAQMQQHAGSNVTSFDRKWAALRVRNLALACCLWRTD